MKNKVVVSIILASVMLLTGCGTEVEATDKAVVMEEEEVIITTEETTSPTETEVTEIASDIVEEEEEVDVTPVEEEFGMGEEGRINGNFFILKQKKETGYKVNSDNFFEVDAEYTVEKQIPIYYVSGNQAGYVKAGTTLSVKMSDTEWFKFAPNTDGISQPYLMVRIEDVEAASSDNITIEEVDIDLLTAEEAKQILEKVLSSKDIETTFLDTPTSDMEMFTYILQRSDDLDYVKEMAWGAVDNDQVDTYFYKTFYVECVEKDKEIECKIYYKDYYDPREAN